MVTLGYEKLIISIKFPSSFTVYRPNFSVTTKNGHEVIAEYERINKEGGFEYDKVNKKILLIVDNPIVHSNG